MKALTKIAWSVALTAMLLAGLLASAQQGKTPSGKKDAGNGTASAQTGSQNQGAKDVSPNKEKATNPQSEEKRSGTNPMYENKDSKLRTQNPNSSQSTTGQAEKSGGDHAGTKKNAKPTPQLHGNHKDVVEYKDGEDGVTHTRPGTSK